MVQQELQVAGLEVALLAQALWWKSVQIPLVVRPLSAPLAQHLAQASLVRHLAWAPQPLEKELPLVLMVLVR
jgi:hypothetical protein